MSLAYGYEIAEANDRYVAIAEDAISKAVASVLPGARLVNVVPALRHLPAWLPGMGFKRHAREVARLTDDMVNLPFAFVKEEMVRRSWVSCLLGSGLGSDCCGFFGLGSGMGRLGHRLRARVWRRIKETVLRKTKKT